MTRKLSLTEQAYRRLHDDLLTCRLAPGEKINIKEVAADRSFSLGAVREALARLSSEGFVTFDDSRGFRATPITVPDMLDLVEVRADIEGQCLRRAIACGDLAWESEIVSTAHRLGRTPPRAGDDPDRLNPDYAAAHAAFHAALVSACDSPWLLRLRHWLYAQSERYRYLAVPLSPKERDLGGEHSSLVEATLARDADRAVAILRDHLGKTARLYAERGATPTARPAPRKTLVTGTA
jgi:DNA-binding GntR family transcriptional regulator